MQFSKVLHVYNRVMLSDEDGRMGYNGLKLAKTIGSRIECLKLVKRVEKSNASRSSVSRMDARTTL